MSLAKTDRRIAGRYLELGNRPDLTERVLDEHARTTAQVLAVTGHGRLLEDQRVLGRAVALLNPTSMPCRTCRCGRCAPCAAIRPRRPARMQRYAASCRSPSAVSPLVCRTPAES